MSLDAPDFVPIWARSPRWRTFADQLTRYYTNRAGLNAWTLTLLKPSDPKIAWARPSQRLIGLNPHFPAATGPITLGRTPALTLAGLTERNLRAYIAHEAGHVRFSCAKPAETQLGSLWNRIEDERIERRMARQHPGLVDVFDTVGDLHLQLEVNSGTLASASLLEWCLVWRWGHDHPLFNDRPADPLWEQVRPLLETAWEADTSEQVIEAASEILRLLDVPEDEQKQDERVSASGGGSPEREDGPPGQAQAEPEPSAQHADAVQDPQATDEPAEVETAGDEQKATGPDDETSPDPEAQGKPHVQTADPAADDALNDLENQQPSDGADLEVPEQEPPAAPSSFADAPSSGGAWAGDEPELARQTGRSGPVVTRTEASARVIARLISAQDQRGMDVSDRSRGRFSYHRHLAGEDRQFRRRTLPTRQRPVLLTVLADTSGSTSQAWCGQTCIEGVAMSAALFARAGMIAGQAAEVYTFDSRTTAVAGRSLSPRQAFEQVQRHPFVASGGTRLAPALELALSRPAGDARHLVVIISDGQLTQNDQLACRALLLRSNGLTSPSLAFLPLLVNTYRAALDQWQQLFPQARAAHDPHAVVSLATSVLNSLQQGRWKER